jgi:hypothetical protein
MNKIKAVIFFVIMSTIFFSCTSLVAIIDTIQFLDSATERGENEGDIVIFIDNRTDEILIIFVNGYKKGVELARILPKNEQKLSISKGRTIYISGGNTGKDYSEIICDNDGETFTIR